MTQIKICGITNSADALCAASSGADAVGFIFHAASPRYVSPRQAREIIELLPSGVVRAGVFVNGAVDEVKQTAASCGLDMIQLHGDEFPEYCRHFPPGSIVKAVFLRSPDDLVLLDSYPVRAFLADARHDGRYGGTGRTADWALAAKAAARYPLILAGGLSEENIAGALATVRPGAVDINSTIERAPGIKDHKWMQRIIAVVKDTNLAASGMASPEANAIFTKRGFFP